MLLSLASFMFVAITHSTYTFSSSTGNCTFDTDICGYTLGGLWKRTNGSTPSFYTGPKHDVSGNGSYVHTEASSPATVGHVSKLTSPSFNPDVSGTYCLSFYYHMYGASMGSLKAQVEGDTNVLWVKYGNQGDRWFYDEFEITSTTSFRVTFTAIRGTSYTSDSALDEIKATPGRCTGVGKWELWSTWSVCMTIPRGQCYEGMKNRTRSCFIPTGGTKCVGNSTQVVSCKARCGTNCTFDTDVCGYTLGGLWRRIRGRTPSMRTGPIQDVSGNGSYVHTEASSPATVGHVSKLTSPSFNPDVSGTYCLSFYYHMYGASMGSLKAQVEGDTNVLWVKYGNQGDRWFYDEFEITSSTSFRVTFTAIRGRSYTSDAALDEIKATPGKCTGVGKWELWSSWSQCKTIPGGQCYEGMKNRTRTCFIPTGGTQCVGNSTQVVSCKARCGTNCTFDTDVCGYTLSGLWRRLRGRTPSMRTGPIQDVSGNGSYVHTEASSPATVGHISKLTSPSFNPDVSGTYCLSFYYHMYGASMGSLKAQVEGDTNVLWVKYGNQGDRWFYDEFEITSSTSFRVTFTAIRGRSYTSDSALDEIKATPERCTGVGKWELWSSWSQCKTIPGSQCYEGMKNRTRTCFIPTGGTQCVGNSTQVVSCKARCGTNCTFDTDVCGYTLSGLWRRIRGRTPSMRTGPIQDVSGNGSYVHTEATSPATVGHVSKLTSPSFNPDVSGTYCLSFYYHMYGASMGSLKAQVDGDTNVLWMKSGNQGDRWFYDEFEMTSSTSFRVTFTAIRGRSYTSDAALDEIKATPGRCTGIGKWELWSSWSQCKTILGGQCYEGMKNRTRTCFIPTGGTQCVGNSTQVVSCKARCGTNCTFDTDVCGYTLSGLWRRIRGRTPSMRTGPIQDVSGNGSYVHTEASSPATVGHVSKLTSPSFNPDVSGTYCLSFYYHMYGASMGSLKAQVDGDTNVLWMKSGNQGDRWFYDEFEITSSTSFRVTFTAIRGRSYTSDAALDEIKATPGRCTANGNWGMWGAWEACLTTVPCTQGTKTSRRSCDSPTPKAGGKMCEGRDTKTTTCRRSCATKCTFEIDTCGYRLDGYWRRHRGRTASVDTGPTNGVNGSMGYVYTETSGSVKPGFTSNLISPIFTADTSGYSCVSFYYHMYGKSMGTLMARVQRPHRESSGVSNVSPVVTTSTVSPIAGNILWRKDGNHGDIWIQDEFTVSSTHAFRIVFTGIRGTSFTGDSALDDIFVTSGPCGEKCTTSSCPLYSTCVNTPNGYTCVCDVTRYFNNVTGECERIDTAVSISMVFNDEYNSDYVNVTSPAFLAKAKSIENTLLPILKNVVTDVIAVKVVKLSKGSTIATIIIIMRNETDIIDTSIIVETSIEKAIKDGKLDALNPVLDQHLNVISASVCNVIQLCDINEECIPSVSGSFQHICKCKTGYTRSDGKCKAPSRQFIIGIIIGASILMVAMFGIYWYRKRRQKNDVEENEENEEEYTTPYKTLREESVRYIHNESHPTESPVVVPNNEITDSHNDAIASKGYGAVVIGRYNKLTENHTPIEPLEDSDAVLGRYKKFTENHTSTAPNDNGDTVLGRYNELTETNTSIA